MYNGPIRMKLLFYLFCAFIEIKDKAKTAVYSSMNKLDFFLFKSFSNTHEQECTFFL